MEIAKIYPPKGDTQCLTRGSLDTLSIYCVSKSLEPFKNHMGKCVFKKLENVLSPGGSLLCRLLRGPFVFNLGVIGLDYRTGGFKILMGKCVFENLKMFYLPEGVCFAAPKGSSCF